MHLLAVGLFQIVVAANGAVPQPTPRAQLDSAATVSAVIAAQEQFIQQWRLEWLRSDWYRWVASDRRAAGSTRLKTYEYSVDAECGRSASQAAAMRASLAPSQRPQIPPACPDWVSRGRFVPDASVVLDSALTPARRVRIAHARDSLLGVVRAAANALPGDQFLIMQHLRLLLDQSYRSSRYLDEAAQVAKRCDMQREFCEQLRGLVYARRRLIDSAAKSFAVMQAAMNKEDYCFQDNTLSLMPFLEGGVFPGGPPPTCEMRVAMNERYWWLADPLWSDSINERRVEHDARNMSRILTGAFTRSERFDWMSARPPYLPYTAELYTQLLTRYGWPSQMFWPVAAQHKEVAIGDSVTRERFRVGVDPIASMQSPPATTYAYTPGRVHTAPSWDALLSPYTANTADWHLDASTDARGNPAWWSEHFKRDRPLYDITSWQTQTWRRRDSLVFAIAASWPSAKSAVSSSRGDYAAMLVRSTGVGNSTAIAQAKGATRSATTFRVTVPADSSLLSLELIGLDSLKSDARLRFALFPDRPLSKFDSGEVAISTPLLVRVSSTRRAIANAEEAAARMYATTAVSANRIGLYWESYGFRAGDTLETTVHVERADALGKLVRVGITRGGASRQISGTRVAWKTVLPSSGDLSSESAVLDVSALRPGDYVVTVASQTDDGRGAMSWRVFTVFARE